MTFGHNCLMESIKYEKPTTKRIIQAEPPFGHTADGLISGGQRTQSRCEASKGEEQGGFSSWIDACHSSWMLYSDHILSPSHPPYKSPPRLSPNPRFVTSSSLPRFRSRDLRFAVYGGFGTIEASLGRFFSRSIRWWDLTDSDVAHGCYQD